MANHPIVHIEIPATDIETTSKFYGDVFGWQIQTDPMYNYSMFHAEGGPAGGFVKVGEPHDQGTMHYKPGEVLVYISTDDIDATLAQIEAHGGKTVVPKTEIPHVGWFGVFTDPTGNRVALFTGMGHQ